MRNAPVTKKIKDRLFQYTIMLRDIDNQIERLIRMEESISSPSGSCLGGTSKIIGTPSDYISVMAERKLELEGQIKEAATEERKENAAIENMVKQIDNPDERAVIRMRYFDRAEWGDIALTLFGDRQDYLERVESYQNRTYKIHGRALLKLAYILDKISNSAVKGSKRK